MNIRIRSTGRGRRVTASIPITQSCTEGSRDKAFFLQVETGWRKFMWPFFREGYAEMTFAANSIRKSALAPENVWRSFGRKAVGVESGSGCSPSGVGNGRGTAEWQWFAAGCAERAAGGVWFADK
jgi:hypothetical protein